ncbi:hypothetical protein BDR22DRAFT_884782 [Usnea florida]
MAFCNSQTLITRDVLGIAMPLEPPFHGGHGQAYGSGQAYHSHGSSMNEDFDERLRSEMQETQMYEDYGQDSFQNQLLRQLSPHQNEGFAQNPVSTGLPPGFAGVHSQGRGLGISQIKLKHPAHSFPAYSLAIRETRTRKRRRAESRRKEAAKIAGGIESTSSSVILPLWAQIMEREAPV